MLERLASRIEGVRADHPARIGIDGVDCAGKTILADGLARVLADRGRSVIRASIDGFHNPARSRRRRGDLSPEGYYSDSFDHSRLIEVLLEPLGPGGDRAFRTAVFDHLLDEEVRQEPRRAASDAVLLFDGVFLMRPELRPYWDLSVFVQVDFAVALARAERRDLGVFGSVEAVRRRYGQRYLLGQKLYLAEVRPVDRAQCVVVNDDPERPVLQERDL